MRSRNQWTSSKYYIFRVSVCSLSYPASKVHALCFIFISDLSGCTIFSLRQLINGTIFGKSLLYLFFDVLHKFCSETFLILRKFERDIIIKLRRSSCKVPVFMKTEFSQQISPKRSSIKFRENPSSLSRVVPCGRIDTKTETDRQTCRS